MCPVHPSHRFSVSVSTFVSKIISAKAIIEVTTLRTFVAQKQLAKILTVEE